MEKQCSKQKPAHEMLDAHSSHGASVTADTLACPSISDHHVPCFTTSNIKPVVHPTSSNVSPVSSAGGHVPVPSAINCSSSSLKINVSSTSLQMPVFDESSACFDSQKQPKKQGSSDKVEPTRKESEELEQPQTLESSLKFCTKQQDEIKAHENKTKNALTSEQEPSTSFQDGVHFIDSGDILNWERAVVRLKSSLEASLDLSECQQPELVTVHGTDRKMQLSKSAEKGDPMSILNSPNQQLDMKKLSDILDQSIDFLKAIRKNIVKDGTGLLSKSLVDESKQCETKDEPLLRQDDSLEKLFPSRGIVIEKDQNKNHTERLLCSQNSPVDSNKMDIDFFSLHLANSVTDGINSKKEKQENEKVLSKEIVVDNAYFKNSDEKNDGKSSADLRFVFGHQMINGAENQKATFTGASGNNFLGLHSKSKGVNASFGSLFQTKEKVEEKNNNSEVAKIGIIQGEKSKSVSAKGNALKTALAADDGLKDLPFGNACLDKQDKNSFFSFNFGTNSNVLKPSGIFSFKPENLPPPKNISETTEEKSKGSEGNLFSFSFSKTGTFESVNESSSLSLFNLQSKKEKKVSGDLKNEIDLKNQAHGDHKTHGNTFSFGFDSESNIKNATGNSFSKNPFSMKADDGTESNYKFKVPGPTKTGFSFCFVEADKTAVDKSNLGTGSDKLGIFSKPLLLDKTGESKKNSVSGRTNDVKPFSFASSRQEKVTGKTIFGSPFSFASPVQEKSSGEPVPFTFGIRSSSNNEGSKANFGGQNSFELSSSKNKVKSLFGSSISSGTPSSDVDSSSSLGSIFTFHAPYDFASGKESSESATYTGKSSDDVRGKKSFGNKFSFSAPGDVDVDSDLGNALLVAKACDKSKGTKGSVFRPLSAETPSSKTGDGKAVSGNPFSISIPSNKDTGDKLSSGSNISFKPSSHKNKFEYSFKPPSNENLFQFSLKPLSDENGFNFSFKPPSTENGFKFSSKPPAQSIDKTSSGDFSRTLFNGTFSKKASGKATFGSDFSIPPPSNFGKEGISGHQTSFKASSNENACGKANLESNIISGVLNENISDRLTFGSVSKDAICSKSMIAVKGDNRNAAVGGNKNEDENKVSKVDESFSLSCDFDLRCKIGNGTSSISCSRNSPELDITDSNKAVSLVSDGLCKDSTCKTDFSLPQESEREMGDKKTLLDLNSSSEDNPNKTHFLVPAFGAKIVEDKGLPLSFASSGSIDRKAQGARKSKDLKGAASSLWEEEEGKVSSGTSKDNFVSSEEGYQTQSCKLGSLSEKFPPVVHNSSFEFSSQERSRSEVGTEGVGEAPLQEDPALLSERRSLTLQLLVKIMSFYPSFSASISDLKNLNGLDPMSVEHLVSGYRHVFHLSGEKLSLKPQLSLCKEHLSPKGCPCPSECRNFHLCPKYIKFDCRDKDCCLGHVWHTDHNLSLLEKFGIEILSPQILGELFSNLEKLSGSKNSVSVCKNYNSLACNKQKCNDLHICLNFVAGFANCSVENCSLNHDILNAECRRILKVNGYSTNQTARDIVIALLKANPSLCEKTKFSFKNTVGLKSRSTLWSHYLEGDVLFPEICYYSVEKKCKKESECCPRLHASLHFHWQVKDQSNLWLNLKSPQVLSLERAYCDVNEDGVDLPRLDPSSVDTTVNGLLTLLGRDVWHAEFDTMTLTNSSENITLDIRRLCTEDIEGKVIKASTFEWYFLDMNQTWVKYGNNDTQSKSKSCISSEDIEKHFKYNSSKLLAFETSQFKYLLNCKKMVQMNVNTKVKRKVRRRPLCHLDEERKKGKLPKVWDAMPSGERLLRVTLSSSSPEYQKVIGLLKGRVSDSQVKKIERIQNPFLWHALENKIKELTILYGSSLMVDVRQFFHGTNHNVVEKICCENFDWRLHGSNVGQAYGQGTYFSTDAKYSYDYCRADDKGLKYMFIARVIVGTIIAGKSSMTRPPLNSATGTLHDSTVDKVPDFKILVKYDKQEYYPEYVLTLS